MKELAKPLKGIIIIGNESNGISADLLEICQHKVTINKLGSAESLNAAIATAVACERLVNG
jgi:RNA methyltransferase, TrmH family